MCLQCCTNAQVWEILGGIFYLAEAQKDAFEGAEDPEWRKGEWGLGRINDPDIILPVDLKPYPSPVTDIDSDDMFPGEEEWMTKAEAFRKLLTLEPEVGHQLFEACTQAGYNYNTDGSLAYWLFDYLGKHLRDNPIADSDINNSENSND